MARTAKKTGSSRKAGKTTTARAAASRKKAMPARAAGRKTAATRGKTSAKRAKAFDQEAMMAAWKKTMAPADGHRRLEPIVGTFAARTTFWMAPGAPPMVSEGVSECRWVLGGRHVEQTYRGSMMGSPFEGIGFTGYDNVQKKYVGTWMDSMGTGIVTSVGVGKPSDKAITFECTSFNPLEGETKFRAVVRIQDADHNSYELWRKGPDGKEFRNMLCEYTRK